MKIKDKKTGEIIEIKEKEYTEEAVKKRKASGESVSFGDIGETAGGIIGYGLGSTVGHPNIGAGAGTVVGRAQLGQADLYAKPNAVPPTRQNIVSMGLAGGMQGIGSSLAQVMLPSPDVSQEAYQEYANKLGDTAMRAPLVAAASYGTGKALQGLGQLKNYFVPKAGAKFTNTIRTNFFKYKQGLMNQWDEAVEALARKYPNKVASFRNVVDGLLNSWDDFSTSTKSKLLKNPTIKKWIQSKGQKGTDLTIKEANKVISDLNTRVKPGKINATDVDYLDTLTDIKAARMDAFPEMKDVSTQYAKGIKPYNDIKNFMKFNRITKLIKGGNWKEPEVQMAIRKILPQKLINQMGGYRTVHQVIKTLTNPMNLIVSGGLIGAGMGIKKAIGNISGGGSSERGQ